MGGKPGSRTIGHPLFKNVNRIKAEALLAEMANGDIIIRPSSRGLDYLVITWRVSLDVYHHIEIREKDKSTPWGLGKSLYVGDERFDDLDEIIARYVDPMTNHCNELMDHPKFLPDVTGRKEVENCLKKMKSHQPKRIVYALSLIPENPGHFLLSYLPWEMAYHEIISITSNGFRFKKDFYSSVEDVLNAFKQDHTSKQQT